MRISLIILMCLSGILEISGQDTLFGNFEPVTVTANRYETPVNKTGRVIHVLTREEIRQLPITSADELLRFIPGLEIQSRQGFGVQSDITIRGTTFNQSIILIDGVRINNPLTGHFNGNIPIPLAAIERVEVLTGASSGIYGPDAVGGVVHFITRNAQAAKSSEDGWRGQFDLNYGSHNTWHRAGYLEYKKGKFRASVGYLRNLSDGEELINQNFGLNPEADSLFHNDFDVQTTFLQAGFDAGNGWDITLQGALEDRVFSAKYFYTVSTFDESRETIEGAWAHAGASLKRDKHHLQIDLAFRQNEDLFAFNPQFSANQHTTRFWNLQVNERILISDNLSLIAGLQADHRNITSTDRGDHEDEHFGGYLAASWTPLAGLTIHPALRLDHDSNYGFEIAPMLNLSWFREKLNLRASGGRNYRSGDFTERFISNNIDFLSGGRNLGNPDLNVESFWVGEAGADYYIPRGPKISATGFYRTASDLIDYIFTPTSEIDIEMGPMLEDGASYFFAQNIASLRTAGLEASINYEHQFSEKNSLAVTLGYLLLEHLNADSLTSKYITGNARHLINGRVNISVGDYTASLAGRWKQRDADRAAAIGVDISPSYGVLNLTQAYQIKGTDLSIRLTVLNLFDETYGDLLGAQMPGRWFLAGINWSPGEF